MLCYVCEEEDTYLFVCVYDHECMCVFVSLAGDLAHFNLRQGEDVVKTIITVSLSLITAP